MCICASMFLAATVTLSSDRESRLYPMESNAVVTVTVAEKGVCLDQGKLSVRISNDGGKETFGEFVHDLRDGNPFTFEVAPKKPGFAYVEAVLAGGSAKRAANIGFGIEKVRVASEEPADFDAWWSGQFAAQAAVKEAVELKRISNPCWDDRYDYFLLKAKTIADEGCTYGFLGVPKNTQVKPGCIVIVQCAGHGYVEPEANFIRPDMMTLTLNVHPWNPMDPGFIDRYRSECKKESYIYRGCSSREKTYFRNAILGCKASIDYVLGRPDFSGELFYVGTSQGGGFGLILGGIYGDRFRALCVQVPALCDLFGSDIGRSDGWPRFGAVTKSREMAYFDAAFWARRVRAPIHFTLGMMDRTCVASSTMAAYNAIPRTTPKFLQIGAEWRHANTWKAMYLGVGFLQNFMDQDFRMPSTRYWEVKK